MFQYHAGTIIQDVSEPWMANFNITYQNVKRDFILLNNIWTFFHNKILFNKVSEVSQHFKIFPQDKMWSTNLQMVFHCNIIPN